MAHDPSSPPKLLVPRNLCPSCMNQTPETGTRNVASTDDSDNDDAVAVAMLLMLEKK